MYTRVINITTHQNKKSNSLTTDTLRTVTESCKNYNKSMTLILKMREFVQTIFPVIIFASERHYCNCRIFTLSGKISKGQDTY